LTLFEELVEEFIKELEGGGNKTLINFDDHDEEDEIVK